jgi:uncharacterized protein YjbI with pentapeptide repeats
MPRLLSFLLVVTVLPFSLSGQAKGPAAWSWKDSNGVVRTRADLDAILREHKLWAESNFRLGKRAELSGASLRGAALKGLDLTKADLAGADMEGADADNTDFTAANLTGSNLRGANLENTYLGGGTDTAAGAVLRGADLSGANLEGATLNRADLTAAILIGADLNGVDFSNAILNDADLASAVKARGAAVTGAASGQMSLRCLHRGGMSLAIIDNDTLLGEGKGQTQATGAVFNNTQLADACLDGVSLSGSNFTGASLTGADLSNADLSGVASAAGDPGGADFSFADLNGAIYQPHEPSDLLLMSKAVNLAGLEYKDDSQPIISLRNGFRDGGFLQQERDVTEAYCNHVPDFAANLPAAGHRSLVQELKYWAGIAQYWTSEAMFDWTCGWGAKPGKPLWIIAVIALLCVPAYWIGMHFKLGRGGIYLVATSTPVAVDGASQRAVRIEVHPDRDAQAEGESRPKRWTRGWWAAMGRAIWNQSGQETGALKTALLFSMMSVFSIGFDGFDAGEWIRALMGREFDLKARGWMRTLSGLQSLLGVGLLALSILSYFGHPFE